MRQCTCSRKQVQAYLGKISGPLLDRFDLHVDVDPVPFEDLASQETGESSAAIRERIEAARDRQRERFRGTDIYCNAMIPDHLLGELCQMDESTQMLMRTLHDRYGISARTHSRLQRVARSAADLRGSDRIERQDLAVAAQFRGFDSKYLK